MQKNNHLSFHISGMHCASCAANISRKLNKTPGVKSASVNYANEQASVELTEDFHDHAKIEKTVASLGYEAHIHDMSEKFDDLELLQKERQIELAELKNKLILGGSVSVLLIINMFFMGQTFLANPWIQLLLATPVQFWVGRGFYQSALSALKNYTSNMDTLVVLGTSVAYFYSLLVIVAGGWLTSMGVETHLYFESASVIITFILLGKYIEILAKSKTTKALQELVKLQPQIAHLKVGSEFRDVEIGEVKVGDILLIKPGEKVPVDSIIVKGSSALNESMVTGESLPADKSVGDKVIAGTINTNGSLTVRAEKVGSDTLLSRIIDQVKQAQGSRPPIQNLVDTIAAYFVPVVIVLAISTALFWIVVAQSLSLALISVINVLIIACPCALGLATPTSLVVGIGKGAKSGILIKNAAVLEIANKVKAIVFDKTGTLTEGKPEVKEFFSTSSDSSQLLGQIAGLEGHSAHPLSQSVVNYAHHKKVSVAKTVTNFLDIPGFGVKGDVDKAKFAIGNMELLKKEKVTLDQKIMDKIVAWQDKGMTVIHVSENSKHVAALGLADTIKPESVKVISQLKKMGIVPVMMTGDAHQAAESIAREVGISEFQAKVLPEDKSAKVKELQRKYGIVAMVGDGVNDSPALAQADVSIAMGMGSDVAIESSSITLLHSDISLVPKSIQLSKATIKNIRQNLVWAFGYNIVLIPLAMGIFYPIFGWLLNPIIAGGAMAFSSVSVVLNALRLKRIKL